MEAPSLFPNKAKNKEKYTRKKPSTSYLQDNHCVEQEEEESKKKEDAVHQKKQIEKVIHILLKQVSSSYK